MAFCRKCGSKLAGDALFCEVCGVKIVHHPESDETPEATPANIIDVTEFPEMTADETITFLILALSSRTFTLNLPLIAAPPQDDPL